MEITFNNFYEFAEWIHKTEKHREELEQENIRPNGILKGGDWCGNNV